MNDVIAIFGPTGCGKTDIAVHMARELGTRVINCDPAQCYAGLPILTNKPGAEHDAIAEHELVGVWPLLQDASVATYSRQARAAIDASIERDGVALIAGGSGMYMFGALCDLQFAEEHDVESSLAADSRRAAEEWYDRVGPDVAHQQLSERDAAAASRIHRNDRKRVVRAWEVVSSGESVSPGGASLWDSPYRHSTTVIGINVERSIIRERIGIRAAEMFATGALAEVAEVVGAQAENVERELSATAARLHGVSEAISVLRGEIVQSMAIELLATRSRQYAKRQDIWARRWNNMHRVDVDLNEFNASQIATQLCAERGTYAVR